MARHHDDRPVPLAVELLALLREGLAAVHPGHTLLATKLDRLARSVPDAWAVADELAAGSVAPSLGGAVHDPTDPVGRMLFNALPDGAQRAALLPVRLDRRFRKHERIQSPII